MQRKRGVKTNETGRTAVWYHAHMRSQAGVCAVASKEKEGSWTMTSPFEVVDHRACLDGGPVIPRHSQQQSDNRDSYRHRTHPETAGRRSAASPSEYM